MTVDTKNGQVTEATGSEPSREATPAQPTPWLVPLLLNVEQAAMLLNVSSRTVKRMVADEAIPGVTRVGRCLRFRRLALEEWIRQGCPRVCGRWRK